MKLLFTIVLSIAIVVNCEGQNHFQNPSFEGTPGAMNTPPFWDWCANNPDTQPGLWGVNMAPTDGITYLGLHTIEATKTDLIAPFLPGNTYTFTVDICIAPLWGLTNFSYWSSNNIGMNPGYVSFYGGVANCDSDLLLFQTPIITAYSTWNTYTFSFTPTMQINTFKISPSWNPWGSFTYFGIDNLVEIIQYNTNSFSHLCASDTNIAPGNYIISIDTLTSTNGNDSIHTSWLNIVANPTVALGSDTTLCLGDSLIITLPIISGIDYTWQDGSTAATYNIDTSGTYYVTADTLGCLGSDTIIVSTQLCAVPQINFACTDSSFCEKNCIDFFDLSTNNPISWTWIFTGANPNVSTDQHPMGICYNQYGQFDVMLVACNTFGCDTLLISAFVLEHAQPQAPIITVQNDTLIAPLGYTYYWYNVYQPNVVIGNGQIYVPTIAGQYYVVIADSNGCNNVSNIVNSSVSMDEQVTAWEHTIQCAVVNNMLYIYGLPIGNENNTLVELYTPVGQLLMHTYIESTGNTINIGLAKNLTNGLYLLKMKNKHLNFSKQFFYHTE